EAKIVGLPVDVARPHGSPCCQNSAARISLIVCNVLIFFRNADRGSRASASSQVTRTRGIPSRGERSFTRVLAQLSVSNRMPCKAERSATSVPKQARDVSGIRRVLVVLANTPPVAIP